MWQRFSVLSLALFATCYFFNLFHGLHFADYDLFARLAVGRLIVVSGEVPLQDIFSFSETKPIWYDHEWLAGLIFYKALQHSGELGLFALSFLTALSTFCFLFSTQQKIQKSPKIGIILLFVVAILSVGMWAAVVRAQVVSFLFFAVEIWLLISFKQTAQRRYLVFLPPLFLIWANTHGGFVVGGGFLAVSLVIAFIEKRKQWHALAVSSILSGLAPCINPYGFGYLEFLFDAIGKQRPLIDEWTPLSFNPLELISSGYSGVILFTAIALAGSFLHWRKIPKEAIVFCAFALFYGVSHKRILPFYYCSVAVFFLPTVVALGERVSESRRETISRVVEVLSLIACICSLWLGLQSFSSAALFKLNISGYPHQAMEWLSCHYPGGGKILSSFNSGSFVLWRGHPNFGVAVDGRYEEVYEDEIVKRVQIALSRKHPERDVAIEQINPDFILRCGLERSRSLPTEWLIVYQDERCEVSTKTTVVDKPDCIERSAWQPNF